MGQTVKLTELAFCAGCAAKLRAEVLTDVINPFGNLFSADRFPELMVGLEKADDAAVYRLSDELALVFTTDFFPPIVDDGYDYGAIAATNSLSDVYAMGGTPLMALNITAMPTDLPPEVIAEIFRGGAEKALEAGCPIVGGHTVRDREPKYGLAVVGTVHPDKILYKGKLKVGDCMVLTKPLGFGLMSTANKAGKADPADFARVTAWMKTLNRDASRLAVAHGGVSGTDVTGFSLLGHSWEMVRDGLVAIEYDWEAIPFVENYRIYMEQELFPGGAYENRTYYEKNVTFERDLSELEKMMLFDPQTSGGLLLGIAGDRLDGFLTEAEKTGQFARVIGKVVEGQGVQVK